MFKKSLTYSIIDGIFWSVMLGFGETYFVPYALTLGASTLQVGLLSSLPLLAGGVAQLLTPGLTSRFGKRKQFVRTGALLQGLCYLPIIGVSFLAGYRASLLIILVMITSIFGLIISPAWQSWMGDLVPPRERGRYFSYRSRWIQLTLFGSVVLGGVLLEQLGFALIFITAFLGRMISFYFLGKQEEPPYSSPAESQFSFWQFVKKIRFNNYGSFVIYSGLVIMAAHICGPYFALFVLEELHFSYFEFMLFHAAFVASKSLFLPVWGHYADRYGARKLLSLSGYLLPIIPLLWFLTDRLGWILAIQLYSGFVWAGFELCSFNFILDCTSPERRARCAAYYQLFVGLGTVSGSLIGGSLLQYPLPQLNPFYFICFLSFISRLIFSMALLPKIREMREVEKISYRTLLSRMFFMMK